MTFKPTHAVSWLLGAICAGTVLWPQGGLAGQESTPATEVEAVRVIANRPGPMVWVVKKGAGRAYIMGTVSPLPRTLVWNSSRLEYLISKSDQVVYGLNPEIPVSEVVKLAVSYPVHILTGRDIGPVEYYKYKDGRTLKGEIGEARYQDLSKFLLKYNLNISSYDHSQPIAAIFDVTSAIINKDKLLSVADAEEKGLEFAKKYKKKVVYSGKFNFIRAQTDLRDITAIEQMQCFYRLKQMDETKYDLVTEIANQWAEGREVVSEKSATYVFNDSCFAGSASYDRVRQREFSDLWSTVMNSLDAGKTSTVIVPTHLLSRPGGLLDSLKRAGIEVLGVNWRPGQKNPS